MTATEAKLKSNENRVALQKKEAERIATELVERQNQWKAEKQKYYEDLTNTLQRRIESAVRYGEKEVIYNFGEFGTKAYECCEKYFLEHFKYAAEIKKIVKAFKKFGYEVTVYGTTNRYVAESSGECGSAPDRDYFVDEMELKISW